MKSPAGEEFLSHPLGGGRLSGGHHVGSHHATTTNHQPTHSISSRSIVSTVDHNHPTQATLSLLSHPFLHLRSQGLAETIIFSSQFSCLLFSIFFLFALHVEIHSPFTLGFILHVPQPPIVLPSHINHFQHRIGSLPSVQLLQLQTLNPEVKA